ncbi:hypothetical protein VTN02DRAFT_777 [Thermoascus thermophilus]
MDGMRRGSRLMSSVTSGGSAAGARRGRRSTLERALAPPISLAIRECAVVGPRDVSYGTMWISDGPASKDRIRAAADGTVPDSRSRFPGTRTELSVSSSSSKSFGGLLWRRIGVHDGGFGCPVHSPVGIESVWSGLPDCVVLEWNA